jgi:hypothetical protein
MINYVLNFDRNNFEYSSLDNSDRKA